VTTASSGGPHPALVGLCAALLPPEAGGPDPAALADQVADYVAGLPAPVPAAWTAGLAALDVAGAICTGRRLRHLDGTRGAGVLDRLARLPLGGLTVDGMKALVLLVAGAEVAAADLRSRQPPVPVRPDAELTVVPSTQWPSVARADVVVVGSGAGGAVVARALARAGASVVVLEEGRRHGVEEFARGHPLERWRTLYRDGGATAALGVPPVVLPIGRGVGGTTLVNSGTCYRPPASVVDRWWREDGLAAAEPGRLDVHLDAMEAMLQVAAVPGAVMGRNGQVALDGAMALRWRAAPLRRNAPGCQGCCQCAIGCPRNAKFGVHLNALPDACAAGAVIVTDARVRRLRARRGRVTGVELVRPDGSRAVVRSERVVVAAGATETPPLLRRSGLGRHPQLGRRLAVHPALGVAGRFAEPVTPWRGVLQSVGVEELHQTEGILVEATATPPGMGSMVLPGYGAPLVDQMARADHLATLGAMVADLPGGRVLGARRSVVTYRLAPRDAGRLRRAVVACGELLFAAGASEVLTGLPHAPTVSGLPALREAAQRADVRQLHLAAFHPTGSCRAGASPADHPVDADGRLRGVHGVWVADASVLPSCPEVNPQLSIMAVAAAIAEGIVP